MALTSHLEDDDMATAKELAEENARLRAQLESLERAGLRCKVSEKKAVSVYGLNARFPVTLYRTQWERLLTPGNVKAILDYIQDHAGELATK